jgi:alkylhydroperoxidase/carboxymuconolactone decarboxylase family protein YurZ
MSKETSREALIREWQVRIGRPPRFWHEDILDVDPGLFRRFLELYARLEEVKLPLKLRHLIWTAVDAVATHLYPVGLERHVQASVEAGASAAEVVEALCIASTVGERSFDVGFPILLEELRAAGKEPKAISRPLTAEEQQFKAKFTADAGRWPSWLDAALRLSPELVPALFNLGYGGAGSGVLDAKSRSMIFLGVYSCPATLDAGAIRLHIRRSIELGASAEELSEVLQLSSLIGLHSFSIGAAPLSQLLKAQKAAGQVQAAQ